MQHEPEKVVVDHRRVGAADGVDRAWLVGGDVAILAGGHRRLSTARTPMRLRVFFENRREVPQRTEEVVSPWGSCLLGFGSLGLMSLSFTQIESSPPLMSTVHPLFSGGMEALTLQVPGTTFQHAVWRALLGIPWGQTRTYGQLAQEIGRPRAARAVGLAVGQNPLAWIIPCHRVLPASGALGGFRWGAALKKRLLEAEKSRGYEINQRKTWD